MREIDAELGDRRKYVRLPGRVIFDEHDEKYHVDAQGKPCAATAKGAVEKVRRFTKGRLEQIARNCNRRDATGSLSPLCFGHTDPEQPDEARQPEPVGYARGYAVAYSPRLKRHVLETDFYVKRDRYEQAKTFPRVSVELWERHGVIDPIALLRRSPARDLGQWTYGRAGGVLRYSMEFQMDPASRDHDPDDDLDLDMPPPPPGGGEEGGVGGEKKKPSHSEMAEQFARHCLSHPHAKALAEHYAMPPEEGGMEDGEEPDPTAPPDAGADDDEPLMNGMAAYPSATNGGLPGGKKQQQKPTQFARDMGRAAYSRLERQQKADRAEIRKLRQERDLETGRRLVATLVAEGFVTLEAEADREALKFSRLDEAGRTERMEEIRTNYQRAPVGATGSFEGPVAARERARTPYDPDDPETMPPRDAEAAVQYQRKHGLYELTLHEAAARAMPGKYGNSSNGNGK